MEVPRRKPTAARWTLYSRTGMGSKGRETRERACDMGRRGVSGRGSEGRDFLSRLVACKRLRGRMKKWLPSSVSGKARGRLGADGSARPTINGTQQANRDAFRSGHEVPRPKRGRRKKPQPAMAESRHLARQQHRSFAWYEALKRAGLQ